MIGKRRVHESHRLQYDSKAGRWLCISCGGVATVSEYGYAQKLYTECKGQLNRHGKEMLSKANFG